MECPALPRASHGRGIPDRAGLYLFRERGKPFYIGQSRSIRKRIGLHTRPSSQENQATFAFQLAVVEARKKRLSTTGTRKTLAQRPRFARLFDEAKSRVRAMDLQFVLCDDPELRTVAEVYLAVTLRTPYNSFETH